MGGPLQKGMGDGEDLSQRVTFQRSLRVEKKPARPAQGWGPCRRQREFEEVQMKSLSLC